MGAPAERRQDRLTVAQGAMVGNLRVKVGSPAEAHAPYTMSEGWCGSRDSAELVIGSACECRRVLFCSRFRGFSIRLRAG
jgi:hypothetical protein